MDKKTIDQILNDPTFKLIDAEETIKELKAALKAMVICAERRYPNFEDETTEAHAALVKAREILDMGTPPKN